MELKNYTEVGKVFTNETQKIIINYDFANDGGAIGVLDIFKAKYPCVIKNFYAKVNSAVTSDGAVALDVGIKAGDTNALLAGILKAAMPTGAVVYDKANQIVPLKVENDAVIAMEIKDAAITAGNVNFYFEIEQF